MKLNKLAYMLCLAMAIGSASCSTDKAWEQDTNSAAGTKVEFSAAEFSVKENKGIVQIPVVCSGDQNGRVSITVAVEPVTETGAEAAEENVNYVMTSKTINIDAEEQASWVEISTVDDDEINEPRKFKITITGAKGATIGDNSTCVVTLKDNDAEFYEKLQGKWTMTSTSAAGAEQKWNVTIEGYDEGEEGYNETLYVVGLMGYNWVVMEMEYHFDAVTKTGYLTIPFGTESASGVTFTGLGECDVMLVGAGDGGYYYPSGSTTANWSEDFNTITFDSQYGIGGLVVQNSEAMGWWYRCFNVVLNR